MANSRSTLTLKLLKSLSSHLSSRRDCKGKPYILCIHSDSPYISFFPKVSVFPDQFHRKSVDKIPVESHVILSHFREELFDRIDESGRLCIQPGKLVPGLYLYESSVNNKCRRWTNGGRS